MVEVIPQDVRQFVLEYIDSIAQLEALLLLRAQPQTEWSAAALAENIYVSKAEAEVIFKQLTTQGFLIDETGRYRYRPASSELEQITGRTAELYRQYLIPMTNLIHAKSKSRIQQFADAFMLRKD